MAGEIVSSIKARAQARRIIAQEEAAEKYYTKKPNGSFIGQWIGFASNGAGLVSYKGRVYEVKVLSKSYAKKYQKVSLTLTGDGNFAAW